MACDDQVKERFVRLAALLRGRGKIRTMQDAFVLAMDALSKAEKLQEV